MSSPKLVLASIRAVASPASSSLLDVSNLHATAAAAGSRLDQNRIADVGGDSFCLGKVGNGTVRAGHKRQAKGLRRVLGLDLITHQPHMLGARADKGDLMLFEDLGKAGILREKAIARMHGVGASDLASRDDLRNVEIAVLGGRSADAYAFVGETHMHGVGVSGRVDCDGGDAELLTCTFDAKCDLSPVGDQDLVEHAEKRLALLDDRERLGKFDGLTVVDQDGDHGAGVRSRDVVHGLHCFDDEERLPRGHARARPRRRGVRRVPASDRRCRPWAKCKVPGW